MLRSPSSLDPLAYHQYAFIPRGSGASPVELFPLPEEVLIWLFTISSNLVEFFVPVGGVNTEKKV